MTRPRPRPLREQLAVAKGQLRAIGKMVKALPAASVPPIAMIEGDRFTSCWSVSRGPGYSVTQALDASGQVWERVIEMDKKTGAITASWWERVGMERK